MLTIVHIFVLTLSHFYIFISPHFLGLAKQCEVIKARHPNIRCIVYRNTVIALNQHRHVSKLLDDDAYVWQNHYPTGISFS